MAGYNSCFDPTYVGQPFVVMTSGCFDGLHAGHVHFLNAAKKLGGRLIVALNSDYSVARNKGDGHPIFPQAQRRLILENLRCVDEVVINDRITPTDVISQYQPRFFVKGVEWAGRDDLPELKAVREYGGQVVFLPHEGSNIHTADILKKIKLTKGDS